ncbi:MAG: cytochrome P450 [Gammaproteobacteria bacterium]|nr:cytochrome P450 [Gammaproteobacteria bacterium]
MAEVSLESIFTPEIIADPYPLYEQLRTNSPVLELPDANMVILTRYADAQSVLRDRRLGHADESMLTDEHLAEVQNNPAIANLRRTMLLKNPPDHTRLRSLVVKAFDARRVEAMRERIRAIATELIDAFIDSSSGDLVRLFTHPLPVIVICDMLGVPEADQAEFVRGTRISGRLIDPSPMTPEELAQANESTQESSNYFADLCDERRGNPQDDLITALVESETEHGKLSKDELTSNIALLFAAGHETTVNLMGNALLALYRNRDQLDLLRDDLSLMPNAVEEFLRYDSSVQLSGRDALEDAEIQGVALPRGRSVLTLLGAANRDPEAFEDPNRLDITRQRIKPLSFGGGIHLCLGAQLARIEAHEALSLLLERLPDLELDNIDNPDWKQTITLRGLKSQPATW